jgi:hypothetical protein
MIDPHVANAILAIVLAVCVAGGLVLWQAIDAERAQHK